MNKETIILIVAQNGLKTAWTFLSAKAAKQEKQADKAKENVDQLKKKANKTKKLAAILTAADEGITAYLRELEKED